MLDLVPFAGARRKVTNAQGQACFIREGLQFQLPEPETRAVTATTVGGNDKLPSPTFAPHPPDRGSDICKWLIDNGWNFDSCFVGTITVDFHEFLFTRPLSPVTLALLL